VPSFPNNYPPLTPKPYALNQANEMFMEALNTYSLIVKNVISIYTTIQIHTFIS
jgi:hypothetical protein